MIVKIVSLLFISLVFSFSLWNCTSNSECAVTSPGGKIKLSFSIVEGIPYYCVDYAGKSIIKPSQLGLVLKNEPSFHDKFKLLSFNVSSVKYEWTQPWGEFKNVTDSHNELKVQLVELDGEKRRMDLIFRLFDDGIGFRYGIPQQLGLDSLLIMDELTQFNFESEHDVWWIPVHTENSYYESLYRKTKIGCTDTINTPATFESTDGLYFAIHEANLTDFASMTLRKTSSTSYQSELVPWANGVKVYAKAPLLSPWRTIIIADKPGDLVTSTLMLNLNEPCAIDDVSWIEPSKYVGIWWGMHLEKFTWGQGAKHGATTENAKKYIDFAAENGFNGVLVEGWNIGWDGNWSADGTNFDFTRAYPDFNLEEVCRYGAAQNVRLIGHHETAGAANHYESQMEKAFELYRDNGVNAVKTGYVNKYLDGKEWHDGQYGVRHYRKIIETAAKYNIMIDNHEPVKGTGLQRTFPNLMTQEGGRGQEYNAWSPDGGNPPDHTTIIPFTRMLAGPFDFTPGVFNFDYQTVHGTRVNTTLAKQLALYIVIFSPQQMACDLPENYQGKQPFDFIKHVPVTWSQTKVLNGKIGEYITMARKDWNSDDWYIGSITNESARELSIDLNFLKPGRKYQIQMYADGAGAHYQTNPYPVEISSKKVTSDDTLMLSLAPGGGCAIQLTALND